MLHQTEIRSKCAQALLAIQTQSNQQELNYIWYCTRNYWACKGTEKSLATGRKYLQATANDCTMIQMLESTNKDIKIVMPIYSES